MRDVELLAPVGSFEALKAAVQNGANAVYLGGKDFGARASANNFDRDELKDAVKYAHIRGVQVFVTTNTLRKENEIEEILPIKYSANCLARCCACILLGQKTEFEMHLEKLSEQEKVELYSWPIMSLLPSD